MFCVAGGGGGGSRSILLEGNPASWNASSLQQVGGDGVLAGMTAIDCTTPLSCTGVGFTGDGDPSTADQMEVVGDNPAVWGTAPVGRDDLRDRAAHRR